MTTHSEPSSQTSSSVQSSPIIKKEGSNVMLEININLEDLSNSSLSQSSTVKRDSHTSNYSHPKIDSFALPPLLKKKKNEPLVFRPFSSFSELELTVRSLNLYLSNGKDNRK